MDLHINLQTGTAAEPENVDIVVDLCEAGSIPVNKYVAIICQATLEHVYDPFSAVKNMFLGLTKNGICLLHSHPVTSRIGYHGVPKDYFRYWLSWWLDLPSHLDKIVQVQLVEFYDHRDHVLSCYKKVG